MTSQDSTPISLEELMAAQHAMGGSVLRIRKTSPFFATLALFARLIPKPDIPTAATDGLDVYYNPRFMMGMTEAERDGVVLHEVLHAALAHVTRRGTRDPKLWNIAADILVNGILVQNGFSLPEKHVRDESLEHLSVEEIYVALPRQNQAHEYQPDLLENPDGQNSDGESNQGQQPKAAASDQLSADKKRALEEHWKQAAAQAANIARSNTKGNLPVGVARAFGLESGQPELDWRTILWRFLTRTPTDFAGYDRRHIHSGLYLETLEGESVRVFVCVDTSGSVDDELVREFMGEIQGILGAYPSTQGVLYYADAEVYGPYPLDETLPEPKGGGGTDFRPFFEAVTHEIARHEGSSVIVYLTDGYGDFPSEAPSIPTIWAVTVGGLPNDAFPFGEVVRLGDG